LIPSRPSGEGDLRESGWPHAVKERISSVILIAVAACEPISPLCVRAVLVSGHFLRRIFEASSAPQVALASKTVLLQQELRPRGAIILANSSFAGVSAA